MKVDQKGFTLIELVMVIVILGILAAVAIPRFVNLSAQAEQATEDGIIGALRSATYIYSVNSMATSGTEVYPDNPFDELKQKPTSFNATKNTNATVADEWTFNSTGPKITHRRNNTSYLIIWSYASDTGIILYESGRP